MEINRFSKSLIKTLGEYMNHISIGTKSCGVFTPKKISGISIWLDAQDPNGTGVLQSNGSVLSSWVDKSGRGNTVTGGGSPTWGSSVLNGKPAVKFNGGQVFTKSSPIGLNFGTGDFSFFLVYQDRGTGNNYTHYIAMPTQDIWALKRWASDGYNYRHNGTSINGFSTTINTPWIGSFNRKAGISHWRRGNTITNSAADTQNIGQQNLSIGNGWLTEYSLADAGEIVVFNGTLTETDYANMYNYFQKKWGII
jgi:hypothetical protein